MLAVRPLVTFPLLALVSFLVAVVGFEVAARVAVSNEALQFALIDSTSGLFRWPGRSLWLAAPFALVAALAVWTARIASTRTAVTLYAVAAAIFGLLYFVGMWDAQVAMSDRRWTAAALAVGMLPFVCAPVVLVAAVVVAVVAWKRSGVRPNKSLERTRAR